jgi:hypothetical protein
MTNLPNFDIARSREVSLSKLTAAARLELHSRASISTLMLSGLGVRRSQLPEYRPRRIILAVASAGRGDG